MIVFNLIVRWTMIFAIIVEVYIVFSLCFYSLLSHIFTKI
jgi:hypothetical protein